MPWKAPYRPRTDNGVTQNFGDGVVNIYTVTNSAQPGYQPVPALTLKCVLRYEEQRLGIQRYYTGQQNQIQIERVIRTPRYGDVTNQDIAVTESGKQYGIDLVQAVTDVYPASQDITLTKIEQKYEVPDDEVE